MPRQRRGLKRQARWEIYFFRALDDQQEHNPLHIPDYPEIMQAAVREMHGQVGNLILAENGIALRGLLLCHLVVLSCLRDTEKVVRFLATEISQETYVNIMDQYHPSSCAGEFEEICCPL